MSPDEVAKVDVGVQFIPMTAGSIVLAYNLPEIEDLRLSRKAYVDILLGKVTKWNDPVIAKANESLKLPDSDIHVVVRADGSGTTYFLTKHLSAISEEFAKSPGTSNLPDWPVGTKSKGNEGVSAAIATTPGSIGYVEFGFAKGAGLKVARLENKAGKYVTPTISSGEAALSVVEMPDDLVAWLPDPEGGHSYPIVTYTWIMCYKKYDDANKCKALKEVLTYCLTEGQEESEPLGYIPLPAGVLERARAAVARITAVK
jgi:phosphate transport system substrate-binding protein